MMEQIELRGFGAGDRDWLVARHQELYARDEGFDETFGPLVGQIIDGFIADHDPACERGWIAQGPQGRLGSIFCVRLDPQTAKLRLFLVTPEARGLGLGQRMLETCVGFARGAGYGGMQLWTHESHKAACALYQRNGWTLQSSTAVQSFGKPNVEQVWTMSL